MVTVLSVQPPMSAVIRNRSMDVSTSISDLNPKRYPRTLLSAIGSEIGPSSSTMTSSDQNNVLHLCAHPMHLRECKPRINVRDNPFAELFLKESILSLGGQRKGQRSTLLL
jgi:hypothetical protein